MSKQTTGQPGLRVEVVEFDCPDQGVDGGCALTAAIARTKQRLIRLLVEEVVIDLDDATNEAGVLPATQLMPSAPWQVPIAALETEALRIGLQAIIARRPIQALQKTEEATLRLPG